MRASLYCCCLLAQSCLTLCNPMDCSPISLLCPRNSPDKNTRMCSHSLLQGIFLTQGPNLHLLHWQQVLHHWAPREATECTTQGGTREQTVDSGWHDISMEAYQLQHMGRMLGMLVTGQAVHGWRRGRMGICVPPFQSSCEPMALTNSIKHI